MSRSNGNDISRTISEFMRECIDENEEALLERSKSAAKSAVKALRQESRKRSGAYAKDWASKVESGETGVEATVYNRKHYQLTHLLENPHKVKNQTGRTYGRTKGDKVISQIADRVGREFSAGGDAK